MKLTIGGSPCTHWSIAKKQGRETEPEGQGWELFQNYKIALVKFRPDYFLYENNNSISAAIKERITLELGRGTYHDKFRAGISPEPETGLLDEYSRRAAAERSQACGAGHSGKRNTHAGKGLYAESKLRKRRAGQWCVWPPLSRTHGGGTRKCNHACEGWNH